MKKLLTRLFIAMLILTFTPTMNTQAKAKIKLNKTKISLQRGKTYRLLNAYHHRCDHHESKDRSHNSSDQIS